MGGGERDRFAVRDAIAPDAPKHPNVLPEDVGLQPDESAFKKWFSQFPMPETASSE